MHNCARSKCREPILGMGFRIENDFSSSNPSRYYCYACGSAIIAFNKRTPPDEIKLVYEEFTTDHAGNIKTSDVVVAGSEGSDGFGASE